MNGQHWPRATFGDSLHHAQHLPRYGEGNDLDGRDHFLGIDRREIRQSRNRQAFIHRIHARDAPGIQHQKPSGFGQDIHAPRCRTRPRKQGYGQHLAQPFRSLIFRHITHFKPRGNDLPMATLSQCCDGAIIKHRALFQHAARQAHGMRQDSAFRFFKPRWAENHAVTPGMGRTAPSAAPRRAATISAMMESAISGAVMASILSPTGA